WLILYYDLTIDRFTSLLQYDVHVNCCYLNGYQYLSGCILSEKIYTISDVMNTITTTTAIWNRIRAKHRGWVFSPKEFAGLGGRAAIDQALSRLQRTGSIRRL